MAGETIVAPAGGAPAAEAGNAAAPVAEVTGEVKPAVVVPEVKAEPAKDPKALHAEQERRLEARATALRADLAKREAAVKEATSALSKREASLKELNLLKEAKESAKDDPISFLEAFGITFEDVAKAAASGTGSDPAARRALKEARELKAKLEAREKSDVDAQKKAEAAKADAQKQTTLSTIDSMLKSDKKYRFAAEFGSSEDVFDAWFQAYQRTGKMPDVHRVAEKVNDYYREQAKKAHAAVSEEFAEAEKLKKAPMVEEKKVPVVEEKKVPVVTKSESDDDEEKSNLRGRTRGQGARSYQGEIMKQLEEARKTRAS